MTWGLASLVANAFRDTLPELMVGVEAALWGQEGRCSSGLEETKMREGVS